MVRGRRCSLTGDLFWVRGDPSRTLVCSWGILRGRSCARRRGFSVGLEAPLPVSSQSFGGFCSPSRCLESARAPSNSPTLGAASRGTIVHALVRTLHRAVGICGDARAWPCAPARGGGIRMPPCPSFAGRMGFDAILVAKMHGPSGDSANEKIGLPRVPARLASRPWRAIASLEFVHPNRFAGCPGHCCWSSRGRAPRRRLRARTRPSGGSMNWSWRSKSRVVRRGTPETRRN